MPSALQLLHPRTKLLPEDAMIPANPTFQPMRSRLRPPRTADRER